MKSNLRVRFAVQAQQDLNSILRYTMETWDEVLADAYGEKLLNGIDSLSHFPEMGVARDQLVRGMKQLIIEQHSVYALATADELIVMRILHKRMNPHRQVWPTLNADNQGVSRSPDSGSK